MAMTDAEMERLLACPYWWDAPARVAVERLVAEIRRLRGDR